jgi:hypothetical protein
MPGRLEWMREVRCVVDQAWGALVWQQRLKVGWIDWRVVLHRGLVGSWELQHCTGCVGGMSVVVVLRVWYSCEVGIMYRTVTGWIADCSGAKMRSVVVETLVS